MTAARTDTLVTIRLPGLVMADLEGSEIMQARTLESAIERSGYHPALVEAVRSAKPQKRGKGYSYTITVPAAAAYELAEFCDALAIGCAQSEMPASARAHITTIERVHHAIQEAQA